MRVAVVGLGKLGLPMAAVFAAAGHDVIGADVSVHNVERINAGDLPDTAPPRPGSIPSAEWELVRATGLPMNEPGLATLLSRYPLKATTDIEDAAAASDFAFIVVPTPSGAGGRFDPSHVAAAASRVAEGFASRPGRGTIVVVSTVMPGDTEAVVAPAVEESGLVVGDTVGLIYSPEFIALGSVVADLRKPAQVIVGASDDAAAQACAEVYRQVHRAAQHVAPMSFLTITEAEMAKVAVNAYLCTKIAYANMVGALCAARGINAQRVASVVGADPRIGGAYLTPAAPAAGPCLPRDARAFATLGEPNLLGAVSAVDEALHEWLASTVLAMAPSECSPTAGTVGICGLAFKPGTPVVDDSPGWKLALRLLGEGRRVVTHDPLAFAPLGASSCRSVTDALWPRVVVIATPHEGYERLAPSAGQTFVDLWGITKPGDGVTLGPWQTPA